MWVWKKKTREAEKAFIRVGSEWIRVVPASQIDEIFHKLAESQEDLNSKLVEVIQRRFWDLMDEPSTELETDEDLLA